LGGYHDDDALLRALRELAGENGGPGLVDGDSEQPIGAPEARTRNGDGAGPLGDDSNAANDARRGGSAAPKKRRPKRKRGAKGGGAAASPSLAHGQRGEATHKEPVAPQPQLPGPVAPQPQLPGPVAPQPQLPGPVARAEGINDGVIHGAAAGDEAIHGAAGPGVGCGAQEEGISDGDPAGVGRAGTVYHYDGVIHETLRVRLAECGTICGCGSGADFDPIPLAFLSLIF
jgi:hypothetical protein